MDVCHRFRANGDCSYGDKFEFSHTNKAHSAHAPEFERGYKRERDRNNDREYEHECEYKNERGHKHEREHKHENKHSKARMLRAKTSNTGSQHAQQNLFAAKCADQDPVRGDAITVSCDHPCAALRGMLGQVVAVVGERARTQLCVQQPLDLATDLGQQAYMIEEVGLARKDFTIIPADQIGKRFHMQKAFLGRKKGDSPYSANAFLDTGANVLETGVKELFHHLEEVDTHVEGLGE